jgi:Anti-sigma-K factor rskA
MSAVTERNRDHAAFDELVAGYALDALDPADERLFLTHLPGCRRCQHALGDYLEITAALAGTGPGGPGQPGPQLRDRIMAATAPGQEDHDHAPGAAAGQVPPAPLPARPRRRRPRRRTILAGAAAAVLIAGGAVAGGLAAHSGTGGPPLASCAAAAQCRDLTLTSASTGKAAARLVIKDGTVWLVPSGLAANDTSRQIYVLWQITGAHTPRAVGSFDVGSDRGRPVRVGPLAVPYQGTWAFAVSRENGRTIPARPSRPVALGQVS